MEVEVQDHDGGIDSSSRIPHCDSVSTNFKQWKPFETLGELSEPLRPLERWNPVSIWPVSSGGQEGSREGNIPEPWAPLGLLNTNASCSPGNASRKTTDSTGSSSLASMARTPLLSEDSHSGSFYSFYVSDGPSLSVPSSLSSSHSFSPYAYRQRESSGNCFSAADSSSVDVLSSRSSVCSETSFFSLDTLYCPYEGCTLGFTGKHRRGTLHRHMRLKHIAGQDSIKQERRYPCPVQGCGKGYMRQDALLKHQRSEHPKLGIPPPVPRR
jgi:hypothetical protein